jgi:hypothetical protein
MLHKIALFLFAICFLFSSVQDIHSQVNTPQLSPKAVVTQELGMGEVVINYSRPSKRDRIIFGGLISYNEIWRLGANKNTTFQCSEDLFFGSDTLLTGTYALYAIPKEEAWELVFYAEYDNWGTPEEWIESKVALRVTADLSSSAERVETLTMSIDDITTNGAVLSISWDEVHVRVPFSMDTQSKVIENITSVIGGPTGNDFYRAAKYYFAENLDKTKALDWIGKAVELRGEKAFWMTRLQAQIMAWNGKYKEAIQTAELSIKSATEAENDSYVRMNEVSISEWKKMK